MFASLLLASAVGLEAKSPERTSINIAATDLSHALLELGQQAGTSIVFSEETTEGYLAPSVQGDFTVPEALETLLAGICLSYYHVRDDLIAIKPGCQNQGLTTDSSARDASAGPSADPGRPSGVAEIIVRERYVTGSRIRTPHPTGATPVDVIDRAEIELAADQDVGGLLRYLPAVAGNSTSTLVSNGGDGTSTVTLRGLPASNTLVLLNGRRLNPDAFQGKSVDLNTIPMGLVERIEILKDGASAIYGSDAIAGVVNVVTRTDFDGLLAEAYYGASGDGDLETKNTTLLFGTTIDKLRVSMGGTYYDQDPIYSRDRSLSHTADDRFRGGTDKRSSATTPSRITLPSGDPVILGPGNDGTDPSHYRDATDEDRFEYRNFTTSVVPSERWSLFANVYLDMSEAARFYLEMLHTDTSATNSLAPVPIFTGFELLDLTVAADNQYNPFGVNLGDVRRRVDELPARTQVFDAETTRWVIGWEGTLGAVHWNLSYADDVTDATERYGHVLQASHVQRALGPADGCTDDCVPLNLFGPPGSISNDSLAYLTVNPASDGRSTLEAVVFTIDFPLGKVPAGIIEVASGIEYREEGLTTDPDPLIAAADTIGGANYGPTHGKRDIWEVYAEAHVPIVRDRRWAKAVDLQLAARLSDYSDFGTTATPRIALRWQLSNSIMLRGSVSEGFRAPTLHQLHTSPKDSFDQLYDPCASADNVGTLPGCLQQSDPTLIQFLTVEGGEKDLDAEHADTWTVGLVWTPETVPGLSASLDHYRIRQKEVVDSSAQFIVNANAREGKFPERVTRDANGNITRVWATLLNLGQRDVSGFDLAASYAFPETRLGAFDFTVNATRITEFEDQFDSSIPTRDHAGTFVDEASSGNGALPDWKANCGLRWRRDGWHAAYTLHYVSELDEIVPVLESRRTIDDWLVSDVQLSYLGAATLWTKLTTGVNNLFDESPPFAAAAFNDSYDSRTYDITGRYWYLRLQKSL